MFTEQKLGKLLAGASALALAGVGFLGATAANAAETGNIDGSKLGSITIHKSAAAPGEAGDGTALPEDPQPILEGVTFTIQPVLHDGVELDLSTAEGWKFAEALGTTPTLPLTGDYSLGTSQAVTTNVNGVATLSGLKLGLYLVTETDSGNNLIKDKSAPFYVSVPNPQENGAWNYDVHVYPKNTLNEINIVKTVDDAALLMGDTVTWTLETEVPASPLPYKSFKLTDVLPTGLEFISWDSVSIGGTPLGDGDYTISDDNTEITLTAAGLLKLDAAGATTVTAVLKTKVIAIPEDGKITNDATVTINGTSDNDPATTNLGTLKLIKMDEDQQILPGAEFELYAEAPVDGQPTGEPLATGVSNENGEIIWQLHLGIEGDATENYWVLETKAPAGYVLPANPWSGELIVNGGEVTTNKVTNHKPVGPNLPMTGAQGTMLFSIAGVGLMGVAAGGALLQRRRARQGN